MGTLLNCVVWAAPFKASSGTATFDYRVLIVGVQGKTPQVKADLSFNPDDLSAASGTVSVDMASLKTGNTLRDSHMRGALSTEQFKEAVFKLEKVQGLGQLPEGQQVSSTASGQFTLRGVTQPLSAPIKLTRRGNTVEVATQFKFDPRSFEVNYPGGASSIAVGVQFVVTGE